MTLILTILTVTMLSCEVEIVQGESMAPALLEGDAIIVNRLAYLCRSPKRGDIVVVANMVEDATVIKRITGVPGDVIVSSEEHFLLETDMYFIEGDSDCSVDSKHYGPVSHEQIVGKVSIILRRADSSEQSG